MAGHFRDKRSFKIPFSAEIANLTSFLPSVFTLKFSGNSNTHFFTQAFARILRLSEKVMPLQTGKRGRAENSKNYAKWVSCGAAELPGVNPTQNTVEVSS